MDYSAGRSNGCTSWSQSDAEQIIPMMKEPSTLYIYPEFGDIAAVAQAVKAGRSPSRAGLYWNASCLREIRSPKFWPKETLEPILIQYKKNHPAPPPRPTPICKGQWDSFLIRVSYTALDAKELEGRLTEAEIKAADPDNDGTLDEKEYLAVVKKKFEAANPDNDGTVDLKELESPAGQELLKLIYK